MKYFFEDRKNTIEAFQSDNLDYDAHLHEYIECGYIISGSCDLYIEDKCIKLKEGDFYIVFPNQIHRYEHSVGIDVYVFIFSPDLLPEFKKTFLNTVPLSPVIDSDTSQIKTLCDIYFNNDMPFESRRGMIIAVIGLALQNTTLTEVDKYNISTIKNILIFCNSHYSEPITINDVADNLHISRSHAAHIFKSKLNTSFSKYINDRRISLACDILKNTNLSVTETAFSAGFSSLRTFNRIFSACKSCTPREYRNNHTSP